MALRKKKAAPEHKPEPQVDPALKTYAIEDVRCKGKEKECELWKTSICDHTRRSGALGRGTGKNGLLIYGEALRAGDVVLGEHITGDSGDVLTRLFNESNISEYDSYITSVVRCRPPGDRNPYVGEINTCHELNGVRDFPKTPPKVVLLLGNIPLKAVLNMQKMLDNRGVFYDCEINGHKLKALPTYGPGAILHKPTLYATTLADFRRVKAVLDDSKVGTELEKQSREYINSRTNLMKWFDVLLKAEPMEITADIETTGLIFFKDRIASLALTFELFGELFGIAFLTLPKPGWFHASFRDEEIHTKLCQILARHKFTFHFGDFDTKCMWKEGLFVKDDYDTLDAHLILDEAGNQKLKTLVTRYMAEGGGYQHKINELIGEKGAYATAPAENLLEYNVDDTYYTHGLKRLFTPQIKALGKYDFFQNHMMPLRRSLTRMSYRGFMVDRDMVVRVSNDYREKMKNTQDKLFDLVGMTFEWSKKDQLMAILFNKLELPIDKRTPKGMPSTDKETLTNLSAVHPAPGLVLELKHWQKMLGTYLDGDDLTVDKAKTTGILQYLDDNDRVHASFLTHGTISGRPTAVGPALMTVPADPIIRTCFMAPPGWKLIDLDYSQAELVFLAYLAQDANFIRAVEEGDLHDFVVTNLLKQPPSKAVRKTAKGINFLKVYGGHSSTLAKKLGMDEKLVERWFSEWDEMFPQVPVYHQGQFDAWRKNKWIEGAFGRRLHFGPAFNRKIESYYDRLSINFPCQNGVAETTNRAVYTIDKWFDKIFGWSLNSLYDIPGQILTVYDSILIEAPDQYVDEVSEIAETVMREAVPGLNFSLKTDKHVTQRWYEYELDKTVEPSIEEELQEDQL